jgi:hypothetical protein
MLKTISNEWQRARDQFVRVGSSSAVVLALAAAPPAEAAIIKLVCDVQYVTCSGAEDRGICGKQDQIIVTFDTAKNLFGDSPATITDDYISWTFTKPFTNGERYSGNINRKTGRFESTWENTRADGTPIRLGRLGECRLAPENKF